jgi:hypothetical protein
MMLTLLLPACPPAILLNMCAANGATQLPAELKSTCGKPQLQIQTSNLACGEHHFPADGADSRSALAGSLHLLILPIVSGIIPARCLPPFRYLPYHAGISCMLLTSVIESNFNLYQTAGLLCGMKYGVHKKCSVHTVGCMHNLTCKLSHSACCIKN